MGMERAPSPMMAGAATSSMGLVRRMLSTSPGTTHKTGMSLPAVASTPKHRRKHTLGPRAQ